MFICFLLVTLSFNSWASTNEFILKNQHLVILAPPYLNKDYFLLELGFATKKKIKRWDYDYNVYVTAALFEDWLHQSDDLKAGGLGFKAGAMFPTQPWVPLLFTTTLGFAKSVLHRNPILGKEDTNAGKKNMLLVEAGLLYHVDKYFVRFAYQLSTASYFHRHTIIMFGVNY